MNDREEPEWMREMIAALGADDVRNASLPAAQRAKEPHIPGHLFRYRGCNEYSLRDLATDCQWMSCAGAYNDPFDSLSTIDSETVTRGLLAGDHRDMAEEFARSQGVHDRYLAMESTGDPYRDLFAVGALLAPSHAKAIGLLGIWVSKLIHAAGAAGVHYSMSRLQQVTCACSLSAVRHSMLMWSHYANQHRGFCVEYDFGALQPDDEKRLMVFPVIYAPNRFDATGYARLHGEEFNILYALLACLYKAPEWSYEREWRLIALSPRRLAGVSTPMPRPSHVYLGARIAPIDARKVRETAMAKGIPVSRMRLHPTTYDMIAEP